VRAIGDGAEWRLPLTEAHRAELLSALDGVEAAGPALHGITREAFPLPALGPVLRNFADEVTRGRGFGLLQRVPVAGLDERGCEILTVGIGCHVGTVVEQQEGARVHHVRDTGADPSTATVRSYQHSGALGYHADPTDIVALLCVRPAASGGMSTIVSSAAVHDEVVRTRPELAEVLYLPWWFDRRTGDGPDSFHTQPVYARRADGTLSVRYGRDYMRSARRGPHVPPLTPAQTEAMALLDHLHTDPRFTLPMDLRPGDMQFLNNHTILHSRTAYRDHPTPELRRHLIRLWLDSP
jgi:hypothetical protein